jgi:hypothetical protein
MTVKPTGKPATPAGKGEKKEEMKGATPAAPAAK